MRKELQNSFTSETVELEAYKLSETVEKILRKFKMPPRRKQEAKNKDLCFLHFFIARRRNFSAENQTESFAGKIHVAFIE